MAGKSFFDPNAPEIVIKSLFSKYDTDGSGHLGKTEILLMLKDDFGFNDKQAEAFQMLFDKDGGGSVSYAEFTEWLRSGDRFNNIDTSSRYYIIQKAIAYFKKYDTDKSGVIERDEFGVLMNSVGVHESQVDGAMKALDTSGDGKISFVEFLNWLNWLPKSGVSS